MVSLEMQTLIKLAILVAGASSVSNGAPAREAPSTLRITVGAKVFTATLSDNATAQAFVATLPLTAKMRDLNANEKHSRLEADLPSNSANPGTVRAGDLMLYGSSTLVLFYETFSTSYSYTRIGTIDDVTGLTVALGPADVTVTFQAAQNRKPS